MAKRKPRIQSPGRAPGRALGREQRPSKGSKRPPRPAEMPAGRTQTAPESRAGGTRYWCYGWQAARAAARDHEAFLDNRVHTRWIETELFADDQEGAPS